MGLLGLNVMVQKNFVQTNVKKRLSKSEKEKNDLVSLATKHMLDQFCSDLCVHLCAGWVGFI